MDTPKQTNPSSAEPPKPTIVTPEGVGIKIDNVNQSLWQYVKKHKLWELLAFVPLVIIWEVLAIILVVIVISAPGNNSNSSTGRGFGYMIALPFVLFFGWLSKLRKQFEDAFLEEFALANHYSFAKDGTVDETYGTIFRLDGDQQVSDVVTGTYDDNDLRLFLYELTIGAGQYRRQYQDTVIELDLHGQLPQLLMVNKQSKNGQLSVANEFGIKNTLQLEGDFNQYFTLYAPQGNEMEALEIFSPDTMALMEDESKHYSVEFAGNRVYIYANGFIGTTEQLTQAFALAKKLIEKIGPLAERLASDSAIMPAPVNLLRSRKHPWYGSKFGLAFIITIAVLGVAIVLFAIIFAKPSPPTAITTSSQGTIDSTTVDANAFPYCGTVPQSDQPMYEQQYIHLIIDQNKKSEALSAAIKANNYLATNAMIEQQVSIDQQYIAGLNAIAFPTKVQPKVTAEITAIQNYDLQITNEEFTTVSESTLNNARDAISVAAKNLRAAVGLPVSTCAFYGP